MKIKSDYDFNCWLTGLIEGDGTIIVPSSLRDTKNKLLYPHIRIAFHKKDTNLAYKIKDILGYGHVITLKSCNMTLWTVSSKLEIIDLIHRLNGNMRTPKLLRLNLLIDWYNCDIPKLGVDSKNINDTSWFSGMSDADSNFNIIVSKRKGNNFRIQRQWRLEFSQKTYHGGDQAYWAMLVSSFLDTSLYVRSREKEGKIYSSFIITVFNENSKSILNNYFSKYPLKSSKFLDYQDWLLCGELETQYKNNTKILLREVKVIKSRMNNIRTQLNWSHLNEIE